MYPTGQRFLLPKHKTYRLPHLFPMPLQSNRGTGLEQKSAHVSASLGFVRVGPQVKQSTAAQQSYFMCVLTHN